MTEKQPNLMLIKNCPFAGIEDKLEDAQYRLQIAEARFRGAGRGFAKILKLVKEGKKKQAIEFLEASARSFGGLEEKE